MLRDIRSPFLSPRLLSLKYTTGSGTFTASEGVGCVKGTQDGVNTGRADMTIVRGFARKPVVVAVASSVDIAAGGGIVVATAVPPSATTLRLTGATSAQTGVNGTAHALALGFDKRDATRYSRRANVVRGELDQTIVVACRIDTSKTALATGVTIGARNFVNFVQNGTGDVTLTLRTAFAHAGCTVVATPVSATGQVAMVDAVSSNSVRIKTFTLGGTTPANAIVNVLIVGDGQGPSERVMAGRILSTQRKPIMFGYSVVYTAGVPAYDINSGDATLTDTNTGRATFTFNQAFAREPIVVAGTVSNGSIQGCTIDNSASTGFEIKCFNNGNSLTDPSSGQAVHCIGIGFDDATEY